METSDLEYLAKLSSLPLMMLDQMIWTCWSLSGRVTGGGSSVEGDDGPQGASGSVCRGNLPCGCNHGRHRRQRPPLSSCALYLVFEWASSHQLQYWFSTTVYTLYFGGGGGSEMIYSKHWHRSSAEYLLIRKHLPLFE